MSDDVRLDLLKDAIAESSLDGRTKDALADDLRYAQEINGNKDQALRGIKRLVISGIRRELLAAERVDDAIYKHMADCPGAGVPKTAREFCMRITSQYPVVLVVILVLAIREFGFGWIARLFSL